MGKFLVKNAVDTGDDSPPCGCKTWIEHWENNTGRDSSFCRNTKKSDHDTKIIGAHVEVILPFKHQGEIYIVPLCKTCNGEKENLPSFLVDEDDLCDANFCVYEIEKLLDSN
jgi:hypothetical protein